MVHRSNWNRNVVGAKFSALSWVVFCDAECCFLFTVMLSVIMLNVECRYAEFCGAKWYGIDKHAHIYS